MPEEETQQQMQNQKMKQKKEEEPKLCFEVGKVFGPEAAKEEDFAVELNQDVGRFSAEHGQAGDRGHDNEPFATDILTTEEEIRQFKEWADRMREAALRRGLRD